MKILHTSDWHLGSTYEGISRDEDHQFFLNWLLETLNHAEINVLIVAGDIFDQAQPSAEAQKIYYEFLCQVSQKTRVKKVILIGGNHDSASRLEAPADLLNLLNVFVVGGVTSQIHCLEKFLCPVSLTGSQVDLVVAAVPFIHEFRLGVRTVTLSEKEIQNIFKLKMAEVYKKLADLAEEKFCVNEKKIPMIATGHLACVGSDRDDAPFEVHMLGSLAALPGDIFDSRFSYVALGHVHRAYRVGNSQAYYCGSPIAFSLKEGLSLRQVNIIEFDQNNSYHVVQKKVPLLRSLLELKGTFEEILEKLKELEWQTPLPPLLSVCVEVEFFAAGIALKLKNKIKEIFKVHAPLLVHVQQNLKSKNSSFSLKENKKSSLKDLTEEQVFIKMCQSQNHFVDESLLVAFRSLL
jgi:exonuclease SbcD